MLHYFQGLSRRVKRNTCTERGIKHAVLLATSFACRETLKNFTGSWIHPGKWAIGWLFQLISKKCKIIRTITKLLLSVSC